MVKLRYVDASMNALVPILMWLTAVFVIMASIRYNNTSTRLPDTVKIFIRRLGLMTYPLYLIHQNAGLAVMGVMMRSGLHPHVVLGMGLTLVLALSWAISVYLEPKLQKAMKAYLLDISGKTQLKGQKLSIERR